VDEHGTLRYIMYCNQIKFDYWYWLNNIMVLSIFSVKDGEFRKYEGPRSLRGFMDFISGQKWREIEPIPWWKSPSSHL